MTNALPDIEFSAYLRLNRASPEEWLTGIRTLLWFERLTYPSSASQGGVGALSYLAVEEGDLACLYVSQDMALVGCRPEHLSVVVPVGGRVEYAVTGRRWSPLKHPAVLKPGQAFDLYLGDGSQVMVFGLRLAEGDRVTDDIDSRCRLDINALVANYFYRARYFLDDEHARAVSGDFLRSLVARFQGGKALSAANPPTLDRRLVRMIEKIQGEPHWEFDLHQLASHSGVSERNLFYLMKRDIGMTPYRFYQRCRLLRVRRRLVDCQCEIPHISWYAADEGFSHLGRFAALYRQHFGELPSETVQWRRRLLAQGRSRSETIVPG